MRKQSQPSLVRTPARQKLFIKGEKILQHQAKMVVTLSCEEDGHSQNPEGRGDSKESQELYTRICEVTHRRYW